MAGYHILATASPRQSCQISSDLPASCFRVPHDALVPSIRANDSDTSRENELRHLVWITDFLSALGQSSWVGARCTEPRTTSCVFQAHVCHALFLPHKDKHQQQLTFIKLVRVLPSSSAVSHQSPCFTHVCLFLPRNSMAGMSTSAVMLDPGDSSMSELFVASRLELSLMRLGSSA